MKTTVSQTESGVMDYLYGQEGLVIDDTAPLFRNIAKPSSDRVRLYLAQTDAASLRGRTGFVAQSNYRPFNDA